MLDLVARARALDYPYRAPPFDCVWAAGNVFPLEGVGINQIANAISNAGADPRAKRTPVLAIGSNRAPVQLRRKFSDFDPPCAVLIAKAVLKDFDIVYGAGISSYGAIGGATLTHSPGTEVEAWVTWLDDKQLERMHETEGLSAGVYKLLELQQIDLRFDCGPRWTSVRAYVQSAGSLNIANTPIALGEIPAKGRKYPSLRQPQMQSLIRDRFAPHQSINDFIAENISNADKRRLRTEALRTSAIPFDWPQYQDQTPYRLRPRSF
ncbi:MAG: hypothetical protein ACO20V_09920 [Alphaproteobacteria bacterium]